MQKKNTGKITSARAKRNRTKETLLKGIPSGKKCSECNLDCTVNREADVEFWGHEKDGEAQYTRETCPKQGRLEKYKIKKKTRSK
jgi:hypothetical protein